MHPKFGGTGIFACIAALTALTFFQFPGHTYLQADTQIYAPILEHLWDRSVLEKDLIVQKPHVSFTLYDETALAFRTVAGLPFGQALAAEQLACRALGIWGLYLIASAAGLSVASSLLAAAIVSLGATIPGPSVLSFEYEPVPRGFAVPLVFLGTGLVAHGRYFAGAVSASAAFLLHAPTVYPFWIVYAALALHPAKTRRSKLYGFAPLAGAAILIWIASGNQGGGTQAQTFFARLDPEQETLQRMRASYNWISVWGPAYLSQYVFLYAATLLAVARLWKEIGPDLRFLALGLPLTGMLSLPVSYLTLERMKLAVMPQIQPMRAVLFVTVMAALLAIIAACVAIRQQRYWESIPWLALAYLIPVNPRVLQAPPMNRILVVLALAAIAALAIRADVTRRKWAVPAVALASVSAFFAIPIYGKVVNYRALHSTALVELCQWARSESPKSAVFLFPDANRELYPGVFRAEALRAVYVDWKAGGQVNYFKDFGEEWWSRWQKVMAKPFEPDDIDKYARLGIDYIVLKTERRLAERSPAFQNSQFIVYSIKRHE